jgi:integrase
MYDSAGMYLEITPAGGHWWRFAYRFGGKRKLLSLGTLPDVKLPEARERRDDARKLLAKGIDPSAQRKAEKHAKKLQDANSFEAVAREWYGKHSPTWVATHATDVLRRLENNLFPEIGDKPVVEITAPVLLAAIRKIESRGAHDLSHRVLGVAGQVFRYAVATGRCERDPSGDLRGALTPHKKRNQAAVTAEELPDLLRKIAGYGEIGDKLTAAALRLLALTFVRTGELIGATWDEIDMDGGTWIVPAARMKMGNEHVVPLSRQAVEVLGELRAIGGGSKYVFPGRNPDKPISNNTMLFALYRLGYKHKMTGHGFRAVASTMLNEAGFRPDVIERQLAHVERNAVRAAYHRAEYLQERQAMMQQWADMLDALKQGAQVIPLQRRAK